MAVHLTPNAIAAINGGDVNSKPLLQVLDVKLIGNPQERYRLILSDAVSTQQAMLATQLNDRVKAGQVLTGSVVQLIDYMCSAVQNRKIIVVLNMETIIPECDIIGKPKPFLETETTSQKVLLGEKNKQPLQVTSTNMNAQNTALIKQSFHPVVQPPYQPPPNYKSRGPMFKNEAPARIIPIAALNPYQGRWAIKARVTAKGDLRRYNNAKGDGKVFSFDLLDSEGGEIRVTCFNAVVDRFYDVIEAGKVYVISKGSLKPAQKNFNHLKNEWEIFLEATSVVDLCPDEDRSIPEQQFSFIPISDIENAENNAIIDIMGVVVSANPSVPILRKNGLETQKRTINMKDTSGRTVELTLWGDFCNKEGQQIQEMLGSGSFPVLAVKAGKVSDFSGKSVGTISASQLFINPNFPEVHTLRQWFDRDGKNSASLPISKDLTSGGARTEMRKAISHIKDESLACPLMIGDRQCNKKVIHSGNSRWQCERCSQEVDECDYRYLLQAQIQDHSGLTWITAFQEAGQELLGCSAKELYLMKHEDQDDIKFEGIIKACLFNEYLFNLKIKEETYGEEQKVKITVVKVDRVNYCAESQYLLDLISNFHNK
uniref:Replication protein A subunit n=1 Tax=Kalanchoe fedtschenkoi TaxID=63787 RepID=A0A7N0SWG1_KALFE